MTTKVNKDQRLNLRLSSDALAQLKDAARVSQQDLTSFLLSAALDRARAVLAEDRVLRLTASEVKQLEASLADDEVPARFAAYMDRYRSSQ